MSDVRDRTSAERWLFECLRSGDEDAAIGRRMGLDIDEVKRWIATLADEFEVQGREGLVELAIAEAPQTAPASGASPAPTRQAPNYRRRAIVTGGFVAAVAGAYGAYRLQQGVEFGAAAPGPTSTPEPSPTPGPTTTPLPIDIVQAIQALQVQRTEFAPGETIGPLGSSSIGFMETEDGRATVWVALGPSGFGLDAVFEPLDDKLDVVRMLDFGRFGGQPRSALLQLSRDRGWTWTASGVALMSYAPPYVLLREVRPSPQSALIHVLELAESGLQLVATLDLFPEGTAEQDAYLGQLAASADGRRLYELSSRSEPPELTVIELPGGAREVLAPLAPPRPSSRARVQLFEASGDGMVLDVAWYIYTPDAATPVGAKRYRVAADGTVQTEHRPVPAEGRASPDGRYAVLDAPLREVPSMQGTGEVFPALVVTDGASGEPLFRVRSAMVGYGYSSSFVTGPEGLARWLADSSGFVARISAAEPTESRDAIFGPDGSLLQMLPAPPEAVNEGRNRYAHGFVPAPDDHALLSWSGVAVYNRQEGIWLTLHPAEATGASNSDPWLGNGDRMVFSLGRGSFGSAAGPEQGVFLDQVVEYPPFPEGDDALAFVTGGPEPTTLWTGLSTAREAVAELAPGTPLAPFDRPQGEVSPGRRATGYFNSEMHISVQTGDGLTGWVLATGLRWAV